jgi:hypothetical protein
MSTTQQPTYRRRTAAELANRPTKSLLQDVRKLRGRILRNELSDAELANAKADVKAIERELRGRTKGASE